ncbi:MAG: hypothetical protein HYR76_01195 [Ignavibacteria bacterium]|nr:hypothetical protein [Ignavibacteria bacterium]
MELYFWGFVALLIILSYVWIYFFNKLNREVLNLEGRISELEGIVGKATKQ